MNKTQTNLILTYTQSRKLLNARRQRKENQRKEKVQISTDLGLSKMTATLKPEGVVFPDGQRLFWKKIKKIEKSPNNCFLVEDNSIWKIQAYSERTDYNYSLMPTEKAPTMLISGIPMHRIKDTNPEADTFEKVGSINPITGKVLDTSMGLGYTAIRAAETADEVVSIELEPAAIELAGYNPWSKKLFNNPRIKKLVGDSSLLIRGFSEATFNRVIHDPPAFRLAGHLYALEYYQELYRIMRKAAKLFHYIGDPQSKSGKNVTHGVIQRLKECGFRNIRPVPRAFGVVAEK